MHSFPTFLNDGKNKIFSLSGISNSKTILCNEGGSYSIYESDRFGFNNPDSEWNHNEIDYLLVGDSFTHGACVSRPYDIGSQLRLLSNKHVINLGYVRNGPLTEYATLKEYLNFKVKNIIWLYYEENDLDDLHGELQNKILKNYLDDQSFTQNLINKNYIKDNLIKLKLEKIFKNRDKITNQFLRILILSKTRRKLAAILVPDRKVNLYIDGYNESNLSDYKYFRQILSLTKDLSSKNNAKLYFVYLPELKRYKGNYKNNNYIKIKKIVDDLDISFIDIHNEVFNKESKPLVFYPFQKYRHYNIAGYKIISDYIYKFTKNSIGTK